MERFGSGRVASATGTATLRSHHSTAMWLDTSRHSVPPGTSVGCPQPAPGEGTPLDLRGHLLSFRGDETQPESTVSSSQSGLPLVGVTGFEPATSSSRTTRATKLRHTPKAPRADEQSIRVARDQPFESEAVSVSTVTSGGQANRYVANGELPIPADTCNQEVCPSWAWVERPLARMVSRSQLVTRAP